ncbi:MAG: mandelate racemase [Bacteroidota bacterium]|nr:mandelate racemase [Bacteroidota bacterium]
MNNNSVKIQQVKVSAYKVPTDLPEADGTIEWNSTTMILVEITAGGKTGIGYTYAHEATALIIEKTLKEIVVGKDAMNIEGITLDNIRSIRNNGDCGIAMMAVSAVDNALWDLKAKIFNVPLCVLLGQIKDAMLIYGSGGFTSYIDKELQDQLGGWADDGLQFVKMKIGTHPEKDVARVRIAREAIGDTTGLFVDANGAYSVKQALQKAKEFNDYNVSWFEEPVTSANLKGLHFIREHAPYKINIAAGEYGYNLPYFDKMLHEGAVDILQADATRCGGISYFMKAGYLAEAYQVPFSSHCAPSLHLHATLALPSFYISEYFHDHIRIEKMFFDGVTFPKNGLVYPDISKPGIGLTLKEKDALKYKI